MNVAELIEELKKYPPHHKVTIQDDWGSEVKYIISDAVDDEIMLTWGRIDMNVTELIEELKRVPADCEVRVIADEHSWHIDRLFTGYYHDDEVVYID